MSSSGKKILVTPRSLTRNGHPLLEQLVDAGYSVEMPFPGRQPTETELLSILPECCGYLAGVEKISGALLEQCPNLKVISRNGVGFENIDAEAAQRLGIAVRITRGANSRGVAELTIGLLFSLVRGIPASNSSIRQGGWDRSIGFELAGKTLGIVGTGQIGQHVARLAAALGMSILAYDLYPAEGLKESVPSLRYTDIDTLFAGSDAVSLHRPAGERPLISGDLLGKMKQGSYIINTARAALVDQQAMLEALTDGRISGYAVDAFESEPPELTPMLLHPGVVLTAHIGGFTRESIHRATEGAIANLLEVLEHGAGSNIA